MKFHLRNIIRLLLLAIYTLKLISGTVLCLFAYGNFVGLIGLLFCLVVVIIVVAKKEDKIKAQYEISWSFFFICVTFVERLLNMGYALYVDEFLFAVIIGFFINIQIILWGILAWSNYPKLINRRRVTSKGMFPDSVSLSDENINFNETPTKPGEKRDNKEGKKGRIIGEMSAEDSKEKTDEEKRTESKEQTEDDKKTQTKVEETRDKTRDDDKRTQTKAEGETKDMGEEKKTRTRVEGETKDMGEEKKTRTRVEGERTLVDGKTQTSEKQPKQSAKKQSGKKESAKKQSGKKDGGKKESAKKEKGEAQKTPEKKSGKLKDKTNNTQFEEAPEAKDRSSFLKAELSKKKAAAAKQKTTKANEDKSAKVKSLYFNRFN